MRSTIHYSSSLGEATFDFGQSIVVIVEMQSFVLSEEGEVLVAPASVWPCSCQKYGCTLQCLRPVSSHPLCQTLK